MPSKKHVSQSQMCSNAFAVHIVFGEPIPPNKDVHKIDVQVH